MKNSSNNLRRGFYKWHRILGLTALVPIMAWALSGLSHPFMSNWFRPFIPREVYELPSLNTLKPTLSLKQVLDANHITGFRNFGLVKLNRQTCYQVLSLDSTYNYYSAVDGRLLPDGDRLYAIQLARYFTNDSLTAIKSISLQKTFDCAYQPINHLLPVWKVSFARPDGMDIYVETGQSRLATFNNHTRKFMLVLFEQLHTWDFLAAIAGDQFRLSVMLIVVCVMFLALCSGLIVYSFFWKTFKDVAQKRKAENQSDKRFIHRYHRQLGLSVSILMLMVFSSAGFHILVKMHNISKLPSLFEQTINVNDITISNTDLAKADSSICKIALIKFGNQLYYQLTNSKKQTSYINTTNGSLLPHGDELFAVYLANSYRNSSEKEKPQITLIKQFTTEYGFINKRLPVEKVSYKGNDDWYFETSTAKLAAHVAGIDRAEGFSFIFLHKFFWMTWAGKDVRDIVSILSALSILTVALLGFIAFIKNK